MDFKLTVENARRLLSEKEFAALQSKYGDKVAEVLENAQQPPEMGGAPKDYYLELMLVDVMRYVIPGYRKTINTPFS